ncbi:MAG: class I SAM-dependent RNA methyltransferase [Chloroflexia bacterium]|nr:class I SAM-dependent RNA methyltransferase [Chloroflexia bacterium]
MRIRRIAQGGAGVGHYQGRVVFVGGALPGEIVSVQLYQKRKSYASGHVVAIEEASSERVEPACPLFGLCGGCQWQYIAYPAQLVFKQAIVREQCRRLGRIEDAPVQPTLGLGNPWAYRSAARLHVSPGGQLGYYAWRSHDVVPLERCPLLVEPLNELLLPLQEALSTRPPNERPNQVSLRYSWFERRCLLLLHGGAASAAARLAADLGASVAELAGQWGRRLHVQAGRGFLLEELGGLSLQVSPTSFFQINVPQTQQILQLLASMLEPQPGERLLDAYAGVGALSLPLAAAGGLAGVTAIESHRAAVADLRENARQLQATPITAHQGTVEAVLPTLRQRFDLVLLDPPRRGCPEAVLEAIARRGPRRIAYVSCHPGTLARDLRYLRRFGYRLVRLQPVDLFPQTFHIESVALLQPL